MVKISKKDIVRFFSKTKITIVPFKYTKLKTPCLEFTGCLFDNGYGQFFCKKKNFKAHRFAWIIARGDPKDLNVLHKCDNKRCVNVEHLFLGAQIDNVIDMVNKNRQTKGSDCHYSKLTCLEASKILTLYKTKNYTLKALSLRYGISISSIWCIVHGKSWKSLAA